MGKGSAFGKTILIGDQFVLEEVPAIVSAIPFQTLCEATRIDGEGWQLEDNRTEVPGYKNKKKDQQVVSINRILEVMKIDVKQTPIKIKYGGDLLAGSGVGASAAVCVSLARALNDEFKLGYTIDQINHVGWEGEFAYHGIPSGVDNTGLDVRRDAAVLGHRWWEAAFREDRMQAAAAYRARQQRRHGQHGPAG